jgi:hypothetical protein
MYDFFKSRIGFHKNPRQRLNARSRGNDGPKVDQEHEGEA